MRRRVCLPCFLGLGLASATLALLTSLLPREDSGTGSHRTWDGHAELLASPTAPPQALGLVNLL